MTIKFGEVLVSLENYSWREWVYIFKGHLIDSNTKCLVLNPDEVELSSDGWTPVAAIEQSLVEYVSIQDIRDIEQSLYSWKPKATVEQLCKAIKYYHINDNFVPEGYQF